MRPLLTVPTFSHLSSFLLLGLPSFLLLGLLGSALGCGGSPPPPKQPITRGMGFHCTGKLCLRTRLACTTVSKDNGLPSCTPKPTAQCFTAHDDDNMRSWMVCFNNATDCQAERVTAMGREPDYLRFTTCQVTQ